MYKHLSRLCLALMIGLLLFVASCAVSKNSAEHVPTAAERCGYADISDTVPFTDKRLIAVAEQLSKNRAPANGILLCRVKGVDRIVIASAIFKDTHTDAGVLVIWISDKILEDNDADVEQFIIAHEIGRFVLGLSDCSNGETKRYLTCEHMIDSYTANIVSVQSTIHSLTRLRDMLIEEHIVTENIFLFSVRIALLKKAVLESI